MIVQTFSLNLIPESAPVVVHVDQYDEGTGRFLISLYEGSAAYSPASGATVALQGIKPDGHGFLYNASLSGNVVTANLEKQMTAVAGKVLAQIVVTESTGRTGSFKFILDVQASALPSDTDMSESDYQAIEELIEEAQEVAQEVAEDRTAAENAATSAGDSAEDAEAWAKGTRDGQAVPPTDPTYQQNSRYWAGQAEQYAQGGLKFINTIYFASLPTSGMRTGDMYNIKDAFTTDSRFEEGAGIRYPEGTNIAWTPNNKWDVLAGNVRVLVSITLAQFNALTPTQQNDPTIWWWVSDADNGTMGGSVTSITAYPELTDKPSINGVEINGAMNSSTLKIAGRILPQGSTVYVDDQGTTATVGKCAEIFNNYKTRGRSDYNGNVASGAYSHAEGYVTTASGFGAHSEGNLTTASGSGAHAEGRREDYDGVVTETQATGEASHAEGMGTLASGKASHSGGLGTNATQQAQTAIGQYNSVKTDTLFEVGNGSSRSSRSNAFEVYNNGNINLAGKIKVKGTELFRYSGFMINAVPTYGSMSIAGHSGYFFNAITSRSTWDDNFREYKPFSIISAEAGSGTAVYAAVVVTINFITKDPDTGRIVMSGSIINASDSTLLVDKISARVLAVALSNNPMDSYSLLD